MTMSGIEGMGSRDVCCDDVMSGNASSLTHKIIKHEKSSITKMLSEVCTIEVTYLFVVACA